MKKSVFVFLVLLLSCSVFSIGLSDFDKTSRVLLLPGQQNNIVVDVSLADDHLLYKDGDSSPVIELSGNQDLYMFVFHVNARGEMLMLWPDAYDDPELNNFVRNGETVEIPSVYTFYGDYSGREYIQGFGFQQMNPELEKARDDFAQKALEGEYLDHNPFRDMHNMKNLARKRDRNWNADIAYFYFNESPLIFDVDFINSSISKPYYIDGDLVNESDKRLRVTEGEHVLSHYVDGYLHNELIVLDATQRTYTLGEEKPEDTICSETTPERVFVFAIGVGEYRDASVYDLRRTPKDAEDFVKTIEAVYGEKADVEHKLLTEEDATKKNIEQFLSTGIHSYIDKQTDVFVYFSGHGMQIKDRNNDEEDGRDEALVPVDFSRMSYRDTVLIDDDLYNYYKAIGNNSQKAFIIIDACFSGGSRKGIKSVSVDSSMKSGMTVNKDSMESEMNKGDENFIFFSAAQGDEAAMEDPENDLENSLFTYYLLKGLSGEADKNYNGFVNAEEIYSFTEEKIKEWFKERSWYSEKVHEPLFNNPDNIDFSIPVR